MKTKFYLIVAGSFLVLINVLPSKATPGLANDVKPPAGESAVALEISTPSKTLVSVYRLTQICKTFGRQEILLGRDAVRVTHRTSGLITIFSAPYKEVFFYNTQTKKCISMPLSKFVSPYAYSWNMVFNANISDVPIKNVGSVSYETKGFPSFAAQKYESTEAFSAAQDNLRKHKEIPARALRSLIYTASERFGAPSPHCRLLQKMYGLPAVSGLPLDLIFFDLHSTKKSYLTTSDIQAIKVDATVFARPTGLQRASTLEQVTSTVNEGIEAF